jgi:hypothetical protein
MNKNASESKEEQAETMVRKEYKLANMGFVLCQKDFYHETEAIRRFIETVTCSFKRDYKKYVEYRSKDAENAPEHVQQWIGEDLAEEHHFMMVHFPDFARQNTFVSTFVLTEDVLLDIAREVGKEVGDETEPEGNGAFGIAAAKVFFDKHSVPFPAGQEWDMITKYKAIRDSFSHSRGNLRRSRKAKKIHEFAIKNPNLIIDKYDRVRITDEFLTEVLSTVEKFMGEVFRNVRERF